ncbi:hypothetical protein [Burkholderia gladioli]|uniref:hypothetical protein n=1 Tax=Burkholderia gladioli TaxID=28095 RepID=UPI0034DAFEC9
MSEVASLVPFGAFHSAWYYRDLFLRDETKHDKFWCPFCGIQVFAILIYKPAEEELARSPHFREKEPHRHGCDGNPAKGGELPVAEGPVRKIEKQLFTLPTRLIEYIEPPEQASRPSRIERTGEPSPDEVKRRRVDARDMHQRARFSVSLVQSLAEAHLGTIRQSYQLRDNKKWSEKQRRDWIKAVFSTEIDLRGASMRYDQAFRDLFFPVRSTPRVYYGEGSVSATDEGYRIDATRRGRADDQDKHGRPFHVRIRADHEPASQRGARRELIAQLERAVEKGFSVKWYGYGQPESVKDWYELRFDEENLTDLFVRRQSSKNAQPVQEDFSQSALNKPDRDGPLAESGSNVCNERAFEITHDAGESDLPMRVTESIANVRSPGAGVALLPAREPNKGVQGLQPLTTKSEAATVLRQAAVLADEAANGATKLYASELAAAKRPSEAKSDARRRAWLAAVQKEYDAIVLEQISAAATLVSAFRNDALAPHQQRKPLLWGRAAWKERLAELEAQDQRNVARWTRLKERRLTPKETDLAMQEAERRARMNGADDVTVS